MTDSEREVAALKRAKKEDSKNRKLVREREEKSRSLNEDEILLPDLPDTKDMRDLALAIEDEIFETYYKLMKNPKAPPAVRKSCADALADRAKGKPEQAVTQTVKIERKDVAIDEVARMILFAKRHSEEKKVEENTIDVTPEIVETD